MKRSHRLARDKRKDAAQLDAPPSPPAPEAASAQRMVDAQADDGRVGQMIMVGLEVALALTLLLARRVWGWAQEERARERVDRALRSRIPTT